MLGGDVDLALAVNYVPAGLCLLKAATLTVWLGMLHAYAAHRALVGTGLALLLDRAFAPQAIFDGSAALLSMFLGHAVHELRLGAAGGWRAPLAAQYLFHVAWAVGALWAHYRDASAPQRARPETLATALLLVAVLAALQADPEPADLRAARYACFALLCVSWVYTVGLLRVRAAHVPLDCAARFPVYFLPVLFAPAPIALCHANGAVLSATACLRALRQQAPAAAAAPPPDPDPRDESAEELERVFREAKAARAAAQA